ncbi:MAG: hemerythrin domain-containing protein [Alphaproteobacteria bacterium]|nr:hemerythrin domain-containing protein [Alphaproteobacteria bacterium]
MPTIYKMLHDDHEKVTSALSKILDSSDGAERTREKLFEEIKADLEVHTRFEEEEFYPQFRKEKADSEAREEVRDALSEHEEAKTMLDELSAMDKTSDEFIEKIRELKEALEHHISDEEDEMFPQAQEVIDEKKAEEMGAHYQSLKAD